MLTREEFLNQMQKCREELQDNAKRRREALDNLSDQYKQDLTILNEEKKAKERQIRDAHTEKQHEVERKMHELKVQWAKEHPIEEVKVVE